jgi:hypothetical protein
LVTVLCLTAGTARADSEQALSAGLSYATFSAPGEKMGDKQPETVSPSGGGALAVSYERAIGTDIALRAEAAFGYFRGGNSEKQSAGSYAVLGDVGAAFRFDVFKYVPYAFAGLGAVSPGGGPIEAAGNSFVLVVGGGCDRLWSRKRSGGVELRIASFGGDFTVVTLGIRATTRWGFF